MDMWAVRIILILNKQPDMLPNGHPYPQDDSCNPFILLIAIHCNPCESNCRDQLFDTDTALIPPR